MKILFLYFIFKITKLFSMQEELPTDNNVLLNISGNHEYIDFATKEEKKLHDEVKKLIKNIDKIAENRAMLKKNTYNNVITKSFILSIFVIILQDKNRLWNNSNITLIHFLGLSMISILYTFLYKKEEKKLLQRLKQNNNHIISKNKKIIFCNQINSYGMNKLRLAVKEIWKFGNEDIVEHEYLIRKNMVQSLIQKDLIFLNFDGNQIDSMNTEELEKLLYEHNPQGNISCYIDRCIKDYYQEILLNKM